MPVKITNFDNEDGPPAFEEWTSSASTIFQLLGKNRSDELRLWKFFVIMMKHTERSNFAYDDNYFEHINLLPYCQKFLLLSLFFCCLISLISWKHFCRIVTPFDVLHNI